MNDGWTEGSIWPISLTRPTRWDVRYDDGWKDGRINTADKKGRERWMDRWMDERIDTSDKMDV